MVKNVIHNLTGKLLVAMLLLPAPGFAADTGALIEQAMNGAHRSEAYKARDQFRHPKETLLFFGLKPDLKVVEITPGGGWYTEILAPVLRDRGTYYAASYRITEDSFEFFRRMDKNYRAKLKANPSVYGKVKMVPFDSKAPSFAPSGSADMVLTFRNYHNFGEEGRAAMNKLAFDALKKGGIYAVVDHTARHMETPNSENRRRFDPVLAIKEIQAAGFELVDFSTLHHKLDDALIYEVGRRSVSGNTDRWTLKFRKP